ncbi:hypothetical protein DICA1_D03642 [Diutina catenulata]
MIYTVKLHPLVLFNINDHITRKISSPYGVLLGTTLDGTTTVNHSFELPLDRHGSINTAFLHKRSDQFSTVLPSLSVVGMYVIGTEGSIALTGCEDFSQPSILLEYVNSSEIRSFYKGNLLKTIFISTQSERIAIETVCNHSHYSDDNQSMIPEIALPSHHGNLAQFIGSVYFQMVKILLWMASNEDDLHKRVRINNKVVYLSNKLNALRQMPKPNFVQPRLSTLLALLTEELSYLQNSKAQITKDILRSNVSLNSRPWAAPPNY